MKTNIAGYTISIEPEAPNLLTEGGGGSGVDGVTFTPHVTQATGGTGYILSWTNDGGRPNPAPVTILNGLDGINGLDGTDGTDGVNGVTFTPHITPIEGGYRLSWTNDGEEIDPLPVDILNGVNGTDGVNGVTFTPHIEEVSGGYQLSWTNDGGQQNPETILIQTETEVAPFILDGSDSVTISGYSDTSIQVSDKYFATKEIPLTTLNAAIAALDTPKGTYKITCYLTREGGIKNSDTTLFSSFGEIWNPAIKLCKGSNLSVVGDIDTTSYGYGVCGVSGGNFTFNSADFDPSRVASTKAKAQYPAFPSANKITRIVKISNDIYSATDDSLSMVLTDIIKNADGSSYGLTVHYLVEKVSDAV